MAMKNLIPWGRDRSSVSNTEREEFSPFLALHREMNRLFDDVFNRFDTSLPTGFSRTQMWPSIEVNASENEVRISAELPGMDEKDIDVFVEDDVLTIRGEKKSEHEDRDRRFSERYYGEFERRIALPFEVEDGKAQASVKNGVLTVILPKSAKAHDKAKRIAINSQADTKH